MKRKFIYGAFTYDYFVEFGERKTLSLIVRPDLRIIVRVPHNTQLSEIEAFLIKKWQWLEKRLTEFRKYKKTHRVKHYVSGEAFYYLGKQYMLEVVSATTNQVKLERGKIKIYTIKGPQNTAHTKVLLEQWYENRRHALFKRHHLQALAFFPSISMPRLRICKMARRWGSYTKDGTVLLHPRLIETPTEAIKYVIIHELCHTVSRNHDDRFYNELNKHLPNWREVKEGLETRHG